MANLYFRYGAMGAGKTIEVLKTAHNYKERGMKVLILKPKIENRDGANIIRSRLGISSECETVEDFFKSDWDKRNIQCIIVDEVQFVSACYIEKFAYIADYRNIPVICYGLRTNFKGVLFEGSKTLMELADKIEEVPTVCWCGKKARFNARIDSGKVVKDGEIVKMGGNESYISLCRKHFFQGNIGENKDEI